MRRASCTTTLFTVGIITFQPAVKATTLLPGQTLSADAISAPDGVTLPVGPGPIAVAPSYDVAPTGNVRNTVLFDTGIDSSIITDANQNQLVAFQQIPVAGFPPQDPTRNYISTPFPSDAVLSISGFGNTTVNVSSILSAQTFAGINTISRSADGNVISLSGFTTNFADIHGFSLPVFISDPSVAFGLTENGTLAFVGIDGVQRNFDVAMIGVIGGGTTLPEPSAACLLAISAAALCARFHRR